MQRISNSQRIFEQMALLFTSFVWTVVILSVLVLFWTVQAMQSNWNTILGIVPTPTPAHQLIMYVDPTATVTSTPTATATALHLIETPALPKPESTATLVLPPSILPDTPNQDDPTPAPVIIPQTDIPPTATAQPSNAPHEAMQTPTRLVIPAVGIDSSVIPVGWDVVEQNGRQYSIWQVANYAVGWHKTSAKLGEAGNTVLAGHHNINGEVFRDLVNVEVGDTITLYTENKAYTYTIELKTIVKEKGEPLEVRQKNAEWIAPTTDERITMVTCWPYTNNTHRVIVVAKPAN